MGVVIKFPTSRPRAHSAADLEGYRCEDSGPADKSAWSLAHRTDMKPYPTDQGVVLVNVLPATPNHPALTQFFATFNGRIYNRQEPKVWSSGEDLVREVGRWMRRIANDASSAPTPDVAPSPAAR